MVSLNVEAGGSAYQSAPRGKNEAAPDVLRYSFIVGWFLSLFGVAEKVVDEESNSSFYIDKRGLVELFASGAEKLQNRQISRLFERVVEAANPYCDKTLSLQKVSDVYRRFCEESKGASSFEEVDSGLERLKKKCSDIAKISYNSSLLEVVSHLQKGDIIVRKYHEENPNPICDAQKIFRRDGWQEAHKCSHLAIYVGEIDGKEWIAEASMPHGNEPQVRRIHIDEARFALAEKNQYLVIRHPDSRIAEEAAKIATLWSEAMKPEAEELPKEELKNKSYMYSYFEALRSLYHSPKLGYFGKHRLFKYYADWKNGKVMQDNFGNKRRFFCSHFVLSAIAMAEMERSDALREMAKNYPQDGEGYIIRRGFWSRYKAICHSGEIDREITTKLDFLRTSPADFVNYVFRQKREEGVNPLEKYQIVALIERALPPEGFPTES